MRGIAGFDLDFLTVHGDPTGGRRRQAGRRRHRAQRSSLRGSPPPVASILPATRADLDANLIVSGDMAEIVTHPRRPRLCREGPDGVMASPHEAALIRALPEAAEGGLIVTSGGAP